MHLRRTSSLLRFPIRQYAGCLRRNVHSYPSLSQSAQAAFQHDEPRGPSLRYEDLNEHLRHAEYAVRGLLPNRAQAIAQDLVEGKGDYPFEEVVFANIGNPQALQQPPITFFRQVLSLLENDSMLMNESYFEPVSQLYPADVIERTKEYVMNGATIGAYSTSQGLPIVRKQIATYLEQRDEGVKADINNLFTTAGASEGIAVLLSAMISKPNVGIMIPIPQYPLYSATITLCNGRDVPYYLDESASWSVSIDSLRQSLAEARADGTDVRAMCVINPGNPTGQVLTQETMQDVIRFCHEERLVLLADEVYQTNTYQPELPFHSFKKVLANMPDCKDDVELASFHSLSKGFIGECGRRGGFMEMVNFDPDVKAEILKRLSINLCCNVPGQVMVGMMCQPPQQGDPSFPLYHKETTTIFDSLKRRANILADAFNAMPGIECGQPQGAMYLFPRVALSQAAIDAAAKYSQDNGFKAMLAPDTFYCLRLLEETGLCVVPGSGFKQYPGTYHFRCTFLPQEDKIAPLVDRIQAFQQRWVDTYGLPDA
eukprot:TRINITY_DN6140_c0_g1_i2.p1 TRINITY_DN6140_c0_g1~~TRINITY_DN6140_c0_g1_i2.p1  ORF type:complete len:605 (+),score=96.85 TRINITY_DN6140_c0_g1_i2:193-1815(+)